HRTALPGQAVRHDRGRPPHREARAMTDPALSGAYHVPLQDHGSPGMITGSLPSAIPLHAELELAVAGGTPDALHPPSADGGMAALAAVPLHLFDQFPGAVLLLDGLGRIGHANGIAELRLDTMRPELMGRDFFRELL